MADDKYEKLFERVVIAQEGISSAVEGLKNNTKSLNDNFALHCVSINEIKTTTTGIRDELIKYVKWLVVGIIIAVGGKEIINIFIDKI